MKTFASYVFCPSFLCVFVDLGWCDPTGSGEHNGEDANVLFKRKLWQERTRSSEPALLLAKRLGELLISLIYCHLKRAVT